MPLSTRDSREIGEDELRALEAEHPEGLTAQQIVAALGRRGDRLTEATFRKYVQLGLLPKSTRVAKDGTRGSQGLYPPTAIRQVQHVRRLMAQGFTIESIQRECLVVRSDVDALERQLDRVLRAVEKAAKERSGDTLVQRLVEDARAVGAELVKKLVAIEERLVVEARLARASV